MKKSPLETWYLLNKFFFKKILIILLALILLLLSFGLYLSFDRSTITEQDEGGPETINGIMVDQELDAKLEKNSVEFWYQFF